MYVGQPSANPIKSVQSVTAAIDTSSVSTQDITITSVTIAKCFLSVAGWRTNISNQWGSATNAIGSVFINATLLNSTTLRITSGTTGGGVQTLNVCILELN